MEQTLMDKLTILADSAKYDVACTSSGASCTARAGILGSCYAPGCCHAFTADGRCVSLLKVLMTNCCAFDCSYCVNRKSNDIPRATFTPRELAELTVEFYRRNYIEGLFLSSAVLGTPDYTTERMLAALRLLRARPCGRSLRASGPVPPRRGAAGPLRGPVGPLCGPPAALPRWCAVGHSAPAMGSARERARGAG